MIIPGYRENTRKVNAKKRHINTKNDLSNISHKKHSLLIKFLDLLHERNIQPVFIAMPVLSGYFLDDVFAANISKRDGVLLDYRYMPGISDDMFIDPIHLGEKGGHIFTERLSEDLAKIIGD